MHGLHRISGDLPRRHTAWPSAGERQVVAAGLPAMASPPAASAARRPRHALHSGGLRPSPHLLRWAVLVMAAAMAGLEAGDGGYADDPRAVVPSLLFAPAPELTPSLPAAGIIGHVAAGSLDERAGLRVGDLLLAIDGFRIHDSRELRLYQELLPDWIAGERWTVVRDGSVISAVIEGLDASSTLGVTLYVPEQQPTCEALLARCGVAIGDDDRPLLALMPGRVLHALQEWVARQGDAPAPAPWLNALAAVYLQAMRGEAKLPGDQPVPVPVLAQFNAFLRAVVEQRTVGIRQPDLATYGIDRYMAALWYPYLSAPGLAVGRARLANDRLAQGLAQLIEDPDGSLNDRRSAAREATNRGGDVTDQFLGQVAAALLDDDNHGGWPFRSQLIWDEAARTPIISALQARCAAGAPDADLAAYALIGPLTMNGDANGVVAAVAGLQQNSSYLAWRAVLTAQAAARMHNQGAVRQALDQALEQAPVMPTPTDLRFYLYCLERSSTLARRCAQLDYAAAHGRPRMFRDHPELVAAALAPDAVEVERRRAEELAACDALNEVAWTMATDESVLDAPTAHVAALEMIRLRGRHLSAGHKDTVAACWARSGGHDKAADWEKAAIADGTRREATMFTPRLELYRSGKTYTEASAHLVPTHDIFPDGGEHLTGFTVDGKRAGHWQVHFPGGKLAIDGWMHKEMPIGRWQTFDKAGGPAADGLVYKGQRVGPWQTFHANGAVASAGSFTIIQGQEQRFACWQWHWDNGKLKEEGGFLGGRRTGRWKAWSVDGELFCEVDFVNGRAQGGPWQGSDNPGVLPPILLPTIQPASQGGNDF